MPKIKVLHIHTRAIVGGSGANTLYSMKGLDRERFEPMLACGPGGPLLNEARSAGLKAFEIPHLANAVNVIKDFKAFLELVHLMKREKFQIVHTHNSKAGILGRLAASVCRVPIIIHTVHSCVFLYSTLNRFLRYFYLNVERVAALFADKLIMISHPLRDEFIKARVAPVNKYVTIYSGIEIDRFHKNFDLAGKRQEFGIQSSEAVVGTVTRLEAGKGVEVFLRAASLVSKEIPQVKFLISGDGPLRSTYEALSRELGIFDKCLFTGVRSDIEEVIACFDVAVLASFYEGMGRVLLEAQAEAKPVVASRAGGISDIVNDGITGLLISPGDEKAFADAIVSLLKDEKKREKMGDEAREWVGQRFSAEKMLQDIVSLYDELIQRKLKKVELC